MNIVQREIDLSVGTYTLKLNITRTFGETTDGTGRLRIDASSSTITPKVFLCQRVTQVKNGTTKSFDEPKSVCTAPDLVEYPADNPVVVAGKPPFFRLSYFDALFRSTDLLIDAEYLIILQLEQMLEDYSILGLEGAVKL